MLFKRKISKIISSLCWLHIFVIFSKRNEGHGTDLTRKKETKNLLLSKVSYPIWQQGHDVSSLISKWFLKKTKTRQTLFGWDEYYHTRLKCSHTCVNALNISFRSPLTASSRLAVSCCLHAGLSTSPSVRYWPNEQSTRLRDKNAASSLSGCSLSSRGSILAQNPYPSSFECFWRSRSVLTRSTKAICYDDDY